MKFLSNFGITLGNYQEIKRNYTGKEIFLCVGYNHVSENILGNYPCVKVNFSKHEPMP